VGTPAGSVDDVLTAGGVGFLFDENIPAAFAEALRLIGYHTVSNGDVNLKGASDEDVIEFCGARNAVWVTKDLDCRKRAAYAVRVRDRGVSAVFLATPKAKRWTLKEQFEVLVRHMRTIENRRASARAPSYYLCRSRGQPQQLTSFAARPGRK
jgi:hypothetical protein